MGMSILLAIFVRASIYQKIAHLRIASKPQICKRKKCEIDCQIFNPISAMTESANRKLAFYKRNQTESCVIAISSWRLTQMHYECAFTIFAIPSIDLEERDIKKVEKSIDSIPYS